MPKRVGSSAVKTSSSMECSDENRLAATLGLLQGRPALQPRRRICPRSESHRCANRCRPPALGVGTIPAREGISNRVMTHRESRFFAARPQPRARLQVRRRENDSRDRGRFGIRKWSQRFDLGHQTIPIDLQDSCLRTRQWMAMKIFIDEIFRRHFADRSEPLRTPRSHPDEIARGHGIPGVVKPIDPPPSSMMSPCSITCISTMLSAAPGW